MNNLTLLRSQWDRAAAVVLTAAGVLAVILGWIGISGANAVVKQLPYIISGGIGGLVLVALGSALWVSSDMRDEWNELRRLRLSIDRLEAQSGSSAQRTSPRVSDDNVAVGHGNGLPRAAVPAGASANPSPAPLS